MLDEWPELISAMHIANGRRMSLVEVLAMSAWEFNLWCDYRTRFGFDADRTEWVTANAGSATACAMGAKVRASELVPKFKRELMNKKVLIARLSALPGAKVRKISKEEREKERKEKVQRGR